MPFVICIYFETFLTFYHNLHNVFWSYSPSPRPISFSLPTQLIILFILNPCSKIDIFKIIIIIYMCTYSHNRICSLSYDICKASIWLLDNKCLSRNTTTELRTSNALSTIPSQQLKALFL